MPKIVYVTEFQSKGNVSSRDVVLDTKWQGTFSLNSYVPAVNNSVVIVIEYMLLLE